MTAVELAMDRARHADFYRRAAAKGKAGGAKGRGKFVKGPGQKGVCGPGGGAACHKGYRPGGAGLEAKAARSGMLGRMQEKSRAAVGASAVAKAGQDVARARAAIVAAKSAGAAKAGARKAAADEAIGGLEARRAAVRGKIAGLKGQLAALEAKSKGSKLTPEKMAAGRKRMDDAFKSAPGADKNRVKASDLAKGMKGMAPADKAAVILKGIEQGKYKIVGKDKAGTDAILARLKARASGASAKFSADAEFARGGFYRKKASAALKASGKKYQKGQTPKGICGPGGGRACHKNYRAARGTDARKALAAEARAARAASRGGAAGATAAARAKADRTATTARLVSKSKEATRQAGIEGRGRKLDALIAKQEADRLARAPARAAEIKAAKSARAKERKEKAKRTAEDVKAKGDGLDRMSDAKVRDINFKTFGKFVGSTRTEMVAAIRAKAGAASKAGRGAAVGRMVARSKGAAATAAEVKRLQARVDRKRKEARAAIRKAEAARSEDQKLRDRAARAMRASRANRAVRASFAESVDDGGRCP